jgi:6-phosphogluconolactonase (cycloisomerase 2 family)
MTIKSLFIAISFSLLSSVFVFAQATPCESQRYIYAQNDSDPNRVQAFCIDSTGALITVTGSPFETGGQGLNGGYVAATRAIVTNNGSRLYVSNEMSGSISGFNIDRTTGVLTEISGSPWTMPGVNGFGTSIAVNLAETFMYLGRANGIAVMSIDSSTGALNGAVPNLISSPAVNGLTAYAAGNLLVASSSNSAELLVYIIQPDGSLTEATGSPLTVSGITSASFNSTGTKLYLASFSLGVLVYSVDQAGQLSFEQSFFVANAPQSLVIAPGERVVYGASPQGVLWRFDLDESGLVTGSQVEEAGLIYSTLAMPRSGNFLYVKDFGGAVRAYSVNTANQVSLALVPGAPFGSPSAGMSLAISEPPSCSENFSIQIRPPSSGTVNLSLKAGSQPVALITSCAVDAVTGLNLSSARFAGATPLTQRNGSIKKDVYDFDGDGRDDVVLYFNITATTLTQLSTQATLTVNGSSNGQYSASQSVRMVAK